MWSWFKSHFQFFKKTKSTIELKLERTIEELKEQLANEKTQSEANKSRYLEMEKTFNKETAARIPQIIQLKKYIEDSYLHLSFTTGTMILNYFTHYIKHASL